MRKNNQEKYSFFEDISHKQKNRESLENFKNGEVQLVTSKRGDDGEIFRVNESVNRVRGRGKFIQRK